LFLMQLNPLTHIFEAFKYGVLGVGTMSWGGLAYAFVFMSVLLSVGILIFNRVQRSFMDTV
jgi:lipopolysaccharide transport system permease protein